MSALVFVDTNIFVYARDAREGVKQARAAQWIDYLWRMRLGRVSVQVLSEFYVTVTRKLKPGLSTADAWDEVAALCAWQPQATDVQLLHRAHEIEERHGLSWWDSLIVGAAQLQSCELLLTEDLQDGAVLGGVTVRSPFSLSLQESVATYSAPPKATERHRPRGRPKSR